jgi:5-(aminomethyl)-3-furanmethanol phosphate kinase
VRPDAVLKIGGSLSRGDGLRSLCETIGRLGERHRLLVVPGGGTFADQVRNAYRRYRLGEAAAHKMAILAMDQYGYVLNHLIPGSCLTPDVTEACDAAESGRTGILLPSLPVIRADPLPHSWQVTSDTIAAWIAHSVDCRRLFLLKDVDGLMCPGAAGSSGLISELTTVQLAEHDGGVDEYLSIFLDSVSLETWIVSGLHPERLCELLETNHTTGTKISKSGKSGVRS